VRRVIDRPIALVLGNEETGLDPATLAACDDVVMIPGSGRVQSLNVASAAAILIYLITYS
jgi:TrmH RNA methyltransferase